MPESQDKIVYLAETDFRNKKIKFGIKAKDRTKHIYIIGKTGMGKSTLLENMAVQDIQNGEGVAFIDPHGSTAEKLLEYIPESRVKDVIYFAPFDTDYPVSFNVMEDVGPDKRHLVANGLMNAFKKIWVDAWSARMEYILNNVLLALLEYPNATILGVNRMLSDKDYRDLVVANVKDSSVRAFWVDEFAKYGDRYMQEAGAAIQNKIGQFVSNPLIRNIIGQPKSSFDVRKIMDEKKILIMNLSKGRMGIENSALLGNMLVTKIYLGAMSRADATPQELQKLPNFYFYVDEFQSFANESFADILSEARKYKLSLTIAHQYVNQMPEEVRDAVFGNVGSMITFRIGPEDAELFEKEFAPEFVAEDLVNLGFSQIYLRLMIDGIGSKPFSATTMPPIPLPEHSFKGKIVEETRKNYASPRSEVESSVNKWYEPVPSGRSPKERKRREGAASGGEPAGLSAARLQGSGRATSAAQAGGFGQPPTARFSHSPRADGVGDRMRSGERPFPGREKAPLGGGEIAREHRPFRPKIERKEVLSAQGEGKPFSLSELKPGSVKGHSKNSVALKEALAAALKEKESASSVPERPNGFSQSGGLTKTPPEEKESGLKEESKKWEEIKKNDKAPDAPREVPEDVLKKILSE